MLCSPIALSVVAHPKRRVTVKDANCGVDLYRFFSSRAPEMFSEWQNFHFNSVLGTTAVPFLPKHCQWVIEMLPNLLSLEALVHCPLFLFFEIYWSCLKPNDVSWRIKYSALSACFLLPEAAGWSVFEHPTTNCCRNFSIPTHFSIGLGLCFYWLQFTPQKCSNLFIAV